MVVFSILRNLLSLYAFLLIINAVLPLFIKTQKPWMTVLARICEPAVRYGRVLVAKFLPNKRWPIHADSLFAGLLCWLLALIIGIFG